MNKYSWPLQTEWLDACVIRELIVVRLIYLPQVVESYWVPGGDLNTATTNKIQNHTKVIFERPSWFTAGERLGENNIYVVYTLWGWRSRSVRGAKFFSGFAVCPVRKLLQKSTSLCYPVLFIFVHSTLSSVFPLKCVLKKFEALCVSRKLVSMRDSDTTCKQSSLSPLHFCLCRQDTKDLL